MSARTGREAPGCGWAGWVGEPMGDRGHDRPAGGGVGHQCSGSGRAGRCGRQRSLRSGFARSSCCAVSRVIRTPPEETLDSPGLISVATNRTRLESSRLVFDITVEELSHCGLVGSKRCLAALHIGDEGGERSLRLALGALERPRDLDRSTGGVSPGENPQPPGPRRPL
jgi:hypothetical protein